MSLSYTCDVHCDRCGNWISGQTKKETKGIASAALRRAKANGWSRYVKSIYTDLCPNCLVESRKTNELET